LAEIVKEISEGLEKKPTLCQEKVEKCIQYAQINNIFPYVKNILIFSIIPYAIIMNTSVDKT